MEQQARNYSVILDSSTLVIYLSRLWSLRSLDGVHTLRLVDWGVHSLHWHHWHVLSHHSWLSSIGIGCWETVLSIWVYVHQSWIHHRRVLHTHRNTHCNSCLAHTIWLKLVVIAQPVRFSQRWGVWLSHKSSIYSESIVWQTLFILRLSLFKALAPAASFSVF